MNKKVSKFHSANKGNPSSKSHSPRSLIYKPQFITPDQRLKLLQWLSELHPLWENRYSKSNPPPEGTIGMRPLLRPVYWFGNWQFACLNYFHPPKNIYNCCVEAEPFPPLLQSLAHRIELEVHNFYGERDIPKGWHFNTCLVNFYGHSIDENGKRTDTARVGEHKDFEPGPVGSISFGERALFQFIESQGRESRSDVILQQWLEDGSLQVFAGDRFKKRLFHRVQRVDHKLGTILKPEIKGFETRRINLTFRYVPNEFIVPFIELPAPLKEDILPYIQELALYSDFFRNLYQS